MPGCRAGLSGTAVLPTVFGTERRVWCCLMSSKFPPVHVVLTGVCGTGKTGVAEYLSRVTGMPVVSADDFHPATNRRKLATGQDLCSADFTPVLHRMRDWIADRALSGTSAIVTCPPLSRENRDLLREAESLSELSGEDATRLLVIELSAPRDVLVERLANRPDHIVPVSVLDSQLASVEPLDDDEFGAVVDASGHPEDVADTVLDTVARLRTAGAVAVGRASLADRRAEQSRHAVEQ